MNSSTSWSDRYPDKKILRQEINCMCNAVVESLLDTIPKKDIAGIYFKGSAQKQWDSLIDYVPEISDVDVHLLFVDDSSVEKYVGTVQQTIGIQSIIEKKFFLKTPQPVHIPRPQITLLNPILNDDDFVPSPKKAITVLYGKPYPQPDAEKLARLMEIDCQHLLDETHFLHRFPLQVIDRPSKYLWQALRYLVWHVSPIGSRVLSLKGLSSDRAWAINRTKIISLLSDSGEDQLVNDYSQFYLHGWDYFLSKYSDTDAGRRAITAGINALTEAIRIAKTYMSSK